MSKFVFMCHGCNLFDVFIAHFVAFVSIKKENFKSVSVSSAYINTQIGTYACYIHELRFCLKLEGGELCAVTGVS